MRAWKSSLFSLRGKTSAQAFYLLLMALWVCSGCQYQFGMPSGGLRGSFFVDNIKNKSGYRLLESELQKDLVNVLRRHEKVSLTSKSQASTILEGALVSVNKFDRERDSRGNVNEVQFIVVFDLVINSREGVKRHRVKNTDYRSSSGIIRADEGKSEAQALQQAMADLAEATVLAIGGAW